VNPLALLRRLRIDPYIVAILLMVVAASLLPARGVAATGLDWLTKVVIAILFFLHGAKLSREAVIAGLGHWRLHLLVLASTFAIFPLLGFAATLLPEQVLPHALSVGVLFLCCLPSTVQSSIAFTSVARGNVAAAVVSASASNLFGIALTPLLAGLLMSRTHSGGFSMSAVWSVLIQLLLPFVAGQVSRIWLAHWADRNRKILGLFDRVDPLQPALECRDLTGRDDLVQPGDHRVGVPVLAVGTGAQRLDGERMHAAAQRLVGHVLLDQVRPGGPGHRRRRSTRGRDRGPQRAVRRVQERLLGERVELWPGDRR